MTTSGRHADHRGGIERARLSLDGLSIGDAFGEKFFTPPGRDRAVPPPAWSYSDDIETALSIAEVLDRHGRVGR